MKQSRRMSFVEAIAKVVVGYGVAVITQILIFPIFGLQRRWPEPDDGRGVHDGGHRPILHAAAAIRGRSGTTPSRK